MPGLSARERAVLVLGAWKEGKPEDPSWRRSLPPDQAREFDRLIGLINAANRELAIVVRMLAQSTEELQIRFAWFVSLVLWQEHLDEIGETVREVAREVKLDRGRRRRLQAALDWQLFTTVLAEEPPPAMPGTMIEGLKETLARQAISAWVQLRTVEQVVTEIGAELGEIDPLKPPARTGLDEAKRSLLTLKEHLRVLRVEFVLREPLPDELAEMREFVRQAA
jgi:hypothetical protein